VVLVSHEQLLFSERELGTKTNLNAIRKSGSGLTSWLVFEGLDTFCEIKLCNQTVGNTWNQFRKYTFDVSDILPQCSGEPVISLNFGSATKIVLDIANSEGPGM
jgi:hypothetical protein